MANQPLAFAEIVAGGILALAGISGSSIGEVMKGTFTWPPKSLLDSGSSSPTPSSVGTLTPGSPSVGGGGTSGDQKTFGNTLAADTGLDPKFVQAWLLHEQPAGSPATPGSNNWLNVGYTDSGPTSTYWQIASMNATDAAHATAQWMQQNQPSILAAAGKSAAAQVAALESSGWASSHYYYESAATFLGVAG